jgi:hypothetical protein
MAKQFFNEWQPISGIYYTRIPITSTNSIRIPGFHDIPSSPSGSIHLARVSDHNTMLPRVVQMLLADHLPAKTKVKSVVDAFGILRCTRVHPQLALTTDESKTPTTPPSSYQNFFPDCTRVIAFQRECCCWCCYEQSNTTW